jgi:hypothetical protein
LPCETLATGGVSGAALAGQAGGSTRGLATGGRTLTEPTDLVPMSRARARSLQRGPDGAAIPQQDCRQFPSAGPPGCRSLRDRQIAQPPPEPRAKDRGSVSGKPGSIPSLGLLPIQRRSGRQGESGLRPAPLLVQDSVGFVSTLRAACLQKRAARDSGVGQVEGQLAIVGPSMRPLSAVGSRATPWTAVSSSLSLPPAIRRRSRRPRFPRPSRRRGCGAAKRHIDA